MPTLNPEIKAAWIEALRGGEYTQTQGVLHDIETDQYCCLGVLCDLAVKAGVIPEPEKATVTTYEATDRQHHRPVSRYGKPGFMNTEELPLHVAKWAFKEGGYDTNPSITYEYDDYDEDGPITRDDTLAELNDGGRSFIEIAELIKEHL